MVWITCDVFISFLDSYSDSTHSLQRIHWWALNVMIIFSKSALIETYLYLVLRVSTLISEWTVNHSNHNDNHSWGENHISSCFRWSTWGLTSRILHKSWRTTTASYRPDSGWCLAVLLSGGLEYWGMRIKKVPNVVYLIWHYYCKINSSLSCQQWIVKTDRKRFKSDFWK